MADGRRLSKLVSNINFVLCLTCPTRYKPRSSERIEVGRVFKTLPTSRLLPPAFQLLPPDDRLNMLTQQFV